jgi:hypothetical protein
MLYEPDFIYTGNKWGYVENGNYPEYKDKLLINMWRKLNRELFNGCLTEPTFIIFSKFSFKENKIKTHGTFQYRINAIDKRCGIYISFEKYFELGDEGILNTLKHEMVHQYLYQMNIRDSGHNSINFIYYMGWFRVSLETQTFIVSDECKEFVENKNLVLDLW